mgnify:FL=1
MGDDLKRQLIANALFGSSWPLEGGLKPQLEIKISEIGESGLDGDK